MLLPQGVCKAYCRAVKVCRFLRVGKQHRPAEGAAGPHAEGPERVRHIMEAVAHLRAAGLDAPAQNLEQLARRRGGEPERRGESAGAPAEIGMGSAPPGAIRLRSMNFSSSARMTSPTGPSIKAAAAAISSDQNSLIVSQPKSPGSTRWLRT